MLALIGSPMLRGEGGKVVPDDTAEEPRVMTSVCGLKVMQMRQIVAIRKQVDNRDALTG